MKKIMIKLSLLIYMLFSSYFSLANEEDYTCLIISNDNQVIPCTENNIISAEKLLLEAKEAVIDSEGKCIVLDDNGNVIPCDLKTEQVIYRSFLDALLDNIYFLDDFDYEDKVTEPDTMISDELRTTVMGGLIVTSLSALLVSFTIGAVSLPLVLTAAGIVALGSSGIVDVEHTSDNKNIKEKICSIYHIARSKLELEPKTCPLFEYDEDWSS